MGTGSELGLLVQAWAQAGIKLPWPVDFEHEPVARSPGLVKTHATGPPTVSDLDCLGWTLRTAFLTRPQMMLLLLVWAPHWKSHSLADSEAPSWQLDNCPTALKAGQVGHGLWPSPPAEARCPKPGLPRAISPKAGGQGTKEMVSRLWLTAESKLTSSNPGRSWPGSRRVRRPRQPLWSPWSSC